MAEPSVRFVRSMVISLALVLLASIGPSAAVAAAPSCVGDCGGDNRVTVDELVTGVNIALDNLPVSSCLPMDASGDGHVTVDELLTAVNNALDGCPTTYSASLDGDQEESPVNTPAVGTATLSLSPDETTLTFELSVTGIAPEQILAAHLHVGAVGVGGPIVLFLSGTSFQSPLHGSLTAADLNPRPEAGINTFADFLGKLRAGEIYANVHTQAHPGGEIRGQLQ